MIEFIISILVPILGGLGVSEADVTTYVTNCSGYIYAILISILVLIVLLVAAHFIAPKGKRHLVRWGASLAWVLALVTMVNMVCYGPLYTNLSVVLNGGGTVSDEAKAASNEVIKKVGEEGMVLVKNNGLLPLSSDVDSMNVFGWASTNPIYGGTGSGSADTSSVVSILQSLSDAGYKTNESLTKMYTDYRADRPAATILGGDGSFDITLPEPTADYYTDDVMGEAESFSDVAMVVISRGGGEGYDLPTNMNSVIHGTYNVADEVSVNPANYAYTNISYTNNGDYDDFDAGESYLELSNTEEAMLDKVCSEFSKVIVVINANNPMELDWVDNYDSIGAVILAPGTGQTGMAALGEIINGSVNPSGKTVDTYVKDLTQTPYYNNIGAFAYNNVDDLKEAIAASDTAYEGTVSFVDYVEGIYVGYKYYETASDDGVINYEDVVKYPFGYGLSYTTFEQKMNDFSDNGDNVTFNVTVTNTGDVAGKDVVEVYFTPPYTNGGIEKASVNLIDYAKTGEIAPGESETVEFTINKEDMASYDANEIKVAGGGYILEAGEYTVSVRSDSHTVLDQANFTVDSDINYSENARTTDNVVATNQLNDYTAGNVTYLSRADGFANYAEATAAPAEEAYVMDDATRKEVEANSTAYYDSTAYDHAEDTMPTLGSDNGLTLADLTGKAYDDPMWDQLLDQMSFEDMSLLVNLGGWQTAQIDSVGKVATSDCDGPAGVNNFITGTYGTPYPTEVLMAQTWNTDLLYDLGLAMGQEYADVNNYGVYGPAMNTHRSAFAGRNFEYYSEDGVLAGKLAAAQVNAMATKGTYNYIKHFAFNDQENHRGDRDGQFSVATWFNEQSAREIYLVPFEMCMKVGDVTLNYVEKQEDGSYANASKSIRASQGVMTSFNRAGATWAGGDYGLITGILRNEWAFDGIVMTDNANTGVFMDGYQMTEAGADVKLTSLPASARYNFDKSDPATYYYARQAMHRVLYTIANSKSMNGAMPGSQIKDGMRISDKIKLAIDIIFGLLIVLEVYRIFRLFRPTKKKLAKLQAKAEKKQM